LPKVARGDTRGFSEGKKFGVVDHHDHLAVTVLSGEIDLLSAHGRGEGLMRHFVAGEGRAYLAQLEAHAEASAHEFADNARGPRIILPVNQRAARGDEVQTTRIGSRSQLVDIQGEVVSHRCGQLFDGLALDRAADDLVAI
jgi:hypothetical protein